MIYHAQKNCCKIGLKLLLVKMAFLASLALKNYFKKYFRSSKRSRFLWSRREQLGLGKKALKIADIKDVAKETGLCGSRQPFLMNSYTK